jgi:hypothetical protein
MPGLPSTAMRVPLHTAPRVNRRVQEDMRERVRLYEDADESTLKERLRELEAEWDTERVLETNAAGLMLAGVALSALHSPKWLILSGLVGAFLLEHALQGWCPPLPVIRRLGVRTVSEIESEKETIRKIIAHRERSFRTPEMDEAEK